MKIFDAHAHYDDEQFDGDRETVMKELEENGVIGVLNCGATYEGALASVEYAEKYDIFYAAVGIHPEHADTVDEDMMVRLRELSGGKKVRAIGEIGLDYYWEENPARDIQLKAFRMQMELARELDLPVIIHDRDAHQDTLMVMKEFPEVTGEVHCFSGSAEFARECLKLGYYIGITGVVTFKNAKKIIKVVEETPLDRLILETDCPYMAPVPYRGKRNRSEYIKEIIEKTAEIKGYPEDIIANAVISNIKSLLRIGA
ncbi:MAG: hydrolase TatD [Firmicutes bacterium]|nr:hydrolase TatD [Bacillota bacterium]